MKSSILQIFTYYVFVFLIFFPISCSRTVLLEPLSPGGNTQVFGKPVFSDALFYFPKDAQKNIKSYSNTTLVLSDLGGIRNANEAVKAGGRLATTELKVGDYIISEPTLSAPKGFFRRVKNIIKSGSDYIVETVESTLDEVFKDVHFKDEYTVSIPIPIPDKGFTVKATNINDTPFEVAGSLKGICTYDFTTQLEVLTKNYEIEKASFFLTTKTNHSLELKVGLGYNEAV